METERESISTAEVKLWLEDIFSKENFKNVLVDIEGNTDKGDGYMGDVVFVHLIGISKDESKKEYNLVLKCAKRNQTVRANTPVKESFYNEMYFYKRILPAFTEFQIEKEIEMPFDSAPEYFGTYSKDNVDVTALQNLNKKGYYLWNKKIPLTRQHIDVVVTEYGKFHAISVAMQQQRPKQFKELLNGLEDFWKIFSEGNMDLVFGGAVQQAHDVLTEDLSEDILLKWKNFKHQATPFFRDVLQNVTEMKVISHGDCWNNNFMFKNENEIPSYVALLDFQCTYLTTPILDLSYFLFCCISEDDIEDMNAILKEYYTSFSNYLQRLGSKPDEVYPFDQFLSEWRKYSKFGIFLAAMVMALLSLDKSDVPDVTENAEKGQGYSDTFAVEVKNKTYFRNRMRPIVKYSVQSGLTD